MALASHLQHPRFSPDLETMEMLEEERAYIRTHHKEASTTVQMRKDAGLGKEREL